jgi:hypothetical protein
MSLQPHLSALKRLVEPFCDEPTLKQLLDELKALEATNSATAKSGGATQTDEYKIVYDVRQALGKYVVGLSPVGVPADSSLIACVTPGCHNGFRRRE